MICRRATTDDVEGICRVCSEGWRATYQGLVSKENIEKVIADFYNSARVYSEVLNPEGWNGWWVALAENEVVVGAGGGGMTGETNSELFVLYADPNKRGKASVRFCLTLSRLNLRNRAQPLNRWL